MNYLFTTIESYDVLEVALKNQLARFLEQRLLVLVDVVEAIDGRRAQPRDHSVCYIMCLKGDGHDRNSTKWKSSGTISPAPNNNVNVEPILSSTRLAGLSSRYVFFIFFCKKILLNLLEQSLL